MSPRLDDIRRDDELLDALGGRRAVAADPAADLLAAWVQSIDDPVTVPPRAGRHARAGGLLRPGRVMATAGVVVATLSVSSVAAAVSGTNVPVFRELGTVTRGLVGGGNIPEPIHATGVLEPQSPQSDGGAPFTASSTQANASPAAPTSASSSSRTAAASSTSPASSSQWVRTGSEWQRRASEPVRTPARTAKPSSTTRSSVTSTAAEPTSTQAPPSSTASSSAETSTKATRPTRTKTPRTSSTPVPPEPSNNQAGLSTATTQDKGTGATKTNERTTGAAKKSDQTASARVGDAQTEQPQARALPMPPGYSPIAEG